MGMPPTFLIFLFVVLMLPALLVLSDFFLHLDMAYVTGDDGGGEGRSPARSRFRGEPGSPLGTRQSDC
jgi:hypothetical protein